MNIPIFYIFHQNLHLILWNRDSPRGVKLYIQRVFIMDDASNFLPLYLRFVRGIIDTSDLPLNVSREILQEHQLVDTIKKSVTKRILDSLKSLKSDSFDEYKGFWKEYGLVLKEGPAEDFENKELIASLLLFSSSNSLKTRLIKVWMITSTV